MRVLQVIGDDTTALECILKTDVEREELLAAEAEMLARDEKNTDDQALNKIYERSASNGRWCS